MVMILQDWGGCCLVAWDSPIASGHSPPAVVHLRPDPPPTDNADDDNFGDVTTPHLPTCAESLFF